MNLDALKTLTTRELVAIAEAAGKLVEERLDGAIRRFLESLVEKKVVAKIPKLLADASIMVMIEVPTWEKVQELVNDAKLIPPLGVAGVNPRVDINYVQEDKSGYKFDVFLQDWPETWSFLGDMDDEFIDIVEALHCHKELNAFTE